MAMHQVQKTALPTSELGSTRCFEAGYFGHGDLVMSTWSGPLEHEPSHNDEMSLRFGLLHGSDALVIASLAGYLHRYGMSASDTKSILLAAGNGILSDTDEIYSCDNLGSLKLLAEGNDWPRYKLKEEGLNCLMPPTPTRPGILAEAGGTGLYTTDDDQPHLVFAAFSPTGITAEEVKPSHMAHFVAADIEPIAKVVCDLALGEYREDIQAFLSSL